MCPWAKRLLHIISCAPVIAIVAIVPAPSAAAQALSPPAPYVVAIDPGHGGSPDNSHPETLFDSGAVGINGLLEKDVTLDIARRVRGLLQGDLVATAMTRDDDRFVDVEERSRVAEDAGASLFVSIHLNSWRDSSVGGSLVLFPSPRSSAFATAMAGALSKRLGPLGVANKGVELRDNWWVHATMPVATVEGAYLTNPEEAALLATESFRQSLAGAVRDGIEAYDPAISKRRAQIQAWNAQHPGATIAVVRSGDPSSQGSAASRTLKFAIFRWAVPLGILLAGVCFRRKLGHGLQQLRWAATNTDFDTGTHRRAPRRRRHQMRKRQFDQKAQQLARPQSVYDELWF